MSQRSLPAPSLSGHLRLWQDLPVENPSNDLEYFGPRQLKLIRKVTRVEWSDAMHLPRSIIHHHRCLAIDLTFAGGTNGGSYHICKTLCRGVSGRRFTDTLDGAFIGRNAIHASCTGRILIAGYQRF
jgi:hypothetical protein